jgi:hypothetical protein
MLCNGHLLTVAVLFRHLPYLKILCYFLLAQKVTKKGSSALLPLRAASPDRADVLLLCQAVNLL